MEFIDLLYIGTADCSAEQAEILRRAGVRFDQRLVVEPNRRVHVTAVHPDDVTRAEDALAATDRREREGYVRRLRFARVPYVQGDMVVTREPDEDGLYISSPYHGGSYDRAHLQLVRGGWDHEHCYLCSAKVLPGDEWWVAEASGTGHPVGMCLACHREVIAGQPA